MEDILDISTENLAQLRKEAAMIRNDTLMRFIRIFPSWPFDPVFGQQAGHARDGADQAVQAGGGEG